MRLLVIAEEFGPNAGISGHRIGSFVTNLARRGVSSVVLAGGRENGEEVLPLSKVYPDLPSGVDGAAREAIACSSVARLPTGEIAPRRSERLRRWVAARDAIARSRALAVATRKVISGYVFLTMGEHRAWTRAAVRYGTSLARGDRFDAVIASSGAEHWNLEVGYALASRLHVPFVIDLRDEWDMFYGRSGRRSAIYPLMRRYARACALAVCATESVAARLREFWPSAPNTVIHNGFEFVDDVAPQVAPKPRGGPLVLGLLGTFWENPYWPKLADAIAHVGAQREVRVVYRGRNPATFEATMMQRAYPAQVRFDVGAIVPKQESHALVQVADVLIAAVYEGSPGAIPSKIYDAIGFAKPLLVLGDRAPSYMVDYLRFCRSPWLVVDANTSATAIAAFMTDAPALPPVDPTEQRERYSRRARSEELHEALLAVTPTTPRSTRAR